MIINTSKVAQKAREDALLMVHRARAGHIASSLSCIDILSVVYYQIDIRVPKDSQNIVLVSKGHAAAGVYAVMANLGLLDSSLLLDYCNDGSILGGHVSSRQYIDLSTGSLGHALSFANGKALALRKKKSSAKIFVVLSDGECDEGSNWEAALFASHHKLSNIKVLIDRNYLQSLTDTEKTLSLEPLEEKWRSFGWCSQTINGHDHHQLQSFMQHVCEKPTLAVCETTKGKGVSFMEQQVLWHYRSPSDSELALALKEVRDNA